MTLVLTMGAFALVVGALGWPGARLVMPTRAWALVLAPAVAGVAASVVVVACLLTRTAMATWLVLLALCGWGSWCWVRRSAGARTFTGRRGRNGLDERWVLAAAALAAFMPVLLVDLPPSAWDARYMWFPHADWFRAGGDEARQVIGTIPYIYRETGYPPLGPALIATVWHVLDSGDRGVALRVTQLVTASGIAAVSFFFTLAARVGRTRDGAALAGLVALVCWGANVEFGLNGYYDLTWAVFLAAAAILLLAGETERPQIAAAAILAATAALIKEEAQIEALLLVVLAGLRAGRRWRRLLPVVGSVGVAVVAWHRTAQFVHASSSKRGSYSRLGGLATNGSYAHERLEDLLWPFARQLGPVALISAGGVVVVVVLTRRWHVELRQPGLLWLLALAAGHVVSVALVFVIANDPLDELLVAASPRVLTFSRLLLVLDGLLAGVALARALARGGGETAPAPDGVSASEGPGTGG